MKQCTVEGCFKPHVARGYCKNHYRVWRKTAGELNKQRRKLCAAHGCERWSHAKGYCEGHYARVLRGATVEAPVRMVKVFPRARTISQYMKDRTKVTETGCHLWCGITSGDGYPRIYFKGVSRAAHRVAYELQNDIALSPAVPVHHTCGESMCVNPLHLQAITPHENTAEMLERTYYKRRIAELEAQLAERTPTGEK